MELPLDTLRPQVHTLGTFICRSPLPFRLKVHPGLVHAALELNSFTSYEILY